MSHKYKIGEIVQHVENKVQVTILSHETMGAVEYYMVRDVENEKLGTDDYSAFEFELGRA